MMMLKYFKFVCVGNQSCVTGRCAVYVVMNQPTRKALCCLSLAISHFIFRTKMKCAAICHPRRRRLELLTRRKNLLLVLVRLMMLATGPGHIPSNAPPPRPRLGLL